jgi:hypothetical protein
MLATSVAYIRRLPAVLLQLQVIFPRICSPAVLLVPLSERMQP